MSERSRRFSHSRKLFKWLPRGSDNELPRRIGSVEDFRIQLAQALDCRVVPRGESFKIKLRTKAALWTYVIDAAEADKVMQEVKEVKIPITEF